MDDPTDNEKDEATENSLLQELGALHERSTRIQDRAARLLAETQSYNTRLEEVLEAYRRADDALKDL